MTLSDVYSVGMVFRAAEKSTDPRHMEPIYEELLGAECFRWLKVTVHETYL